MQQLFKEGQLVEALRASYILAPDIWSPEHSIQMRATVLDVESLKNDILAALPEDDSVKDYLNNPSTPWSKSDTGLLLYHNHVYILNKGDLCVRVLQSKHDHVTAGHPGFKKTLKLIRREFFWPSLHAFVAEFCRTCDNCPQNKAARHKPY